jgi:kinesin family protein C2/C3
MDNIASSFLPQKPSQQQFCLALRNGLILCNVLNKVNPGAVVKVVDNPALAATATATVEGAAHSAIQYFENMRNFLYAVKDMQLLTFEASDLEKVNLFPFFFLNFYFNLLLLFEICKMQKMIKLIKSKPLIQLNLSGFSLDLYILK